ncbi:MAG: hypothetical protein J2P31_08485, partial [Blastocatellia bacterium]|nr:hypothetical protein [Blastocatellia bacterium]
EYTDQILTHGLPLLLRLVDRNWELRATTRISDTDLVFENPRGRLNISLCNQHNMTTLAGRLRRLREQISDQVLEESIHERFILIRDARLPIGSHAIKTREHREQLVAQGFLWISASTAMLAALDTLRGLLSEAKAGDLSNAGETVPTAAVEEWLALNLDLKLGPLRELINHLLPETMAPDRLVNDADFNLSEDIGELLHNHYLVAVADAACKLERDEDEIGECARRHPERFGLLDGPPAIIFQPTGAHERRQGDGLSIPMEQFFSEIFASLAGRDASLNFRAAISDAEPDLEEWRRALIGHVYYKMLGPSLRRHQTALQEATDNVLYLWDATQEMCDWLAGVLWQHLGTHASSVQGFESPHAGSVHSRASAIWRIPETKKWFAVRLESGQPDPDSDLAQAILYHQLLHAAGQEPHESLSLVTFGPQRREHTFSAAELSADEVARPSLSFSAMRPQLPKPDPLHGCSKAPLGIDGEGRLCLIDFAKPEDAHLLVAGMAGSGKTEWLRTAIAGLTITNTPETLRLLLIDATGTA